MSKHDNGFSVERTITIAYMRDPRVMGIVAGSLYGIMSILGVDTTYEESCTSARFIRDGLRDVDIIDGEHVCVGGEA
nr:MAG TPA_asm: hypothetical protein [Caudoviricetes sp.]